MTRRQKRRKASPPTTGDRLRKFLRDSAAPAGARMVDAARRGESVLDAWLSVMKTQALAAVAEEHYDWVAEKRGRKVVIEWDIDDDGEHGITIRRIEPNGDTSSAPAP